MKRYVVRLGHVVWWFDAEDERHAIEQWVDQVRDEIEVTEQ